MKQTVGSVLAGASLESAEVELKPIAAPTPILIDRKQLEDKLGTGVPQLTLVETDAEELAELIDRGSVIVEQHRDEQGKLIGLLLDTGHRVELRGARFSDGLVTLEVGGATATFRLDEDDRPAPGAPDWTGVDGSRRETVEAGRERLAAVTALAWEKAGERRPEDLGEVVEMAASYLGSVRTASRVLDGAWSSAVGISDAEWRAVAAERDPATLALVTKAFERWHKLSGVLVHNLQRAKAHGGGKLPAQQQAWLDDLTEMRDGLAGEMTRLSELPSGSIAKTER
ncbi:hypothetical protein GCM10022288_15830 [Gryllotalpicola kribbensis]|uniref:Uncharacterized protein n=1 Tax=Gryllotalpicola kribbensis TaxID=993084 RepID=A0ABP8ASB4_9MICO